MLTVMCVGYTKNLQNEGSEEDLLKAGDRHKMEIPLLTLQRYDAKRERALEITYVNRKSTKKDHDPP